MEENTSPDYNIEPVFNSVEDFADTANMFIFNGGHFGEIEEALTQVILKEETSKIQRYKVSMSKNKEAKFTAVPVEFLKRLSANNPQKVINGIYREIGTLDAKLTMLADHDLSQEMQDKVKGVNMQRYALDQTKNGTMLFQYIQESGTELDKIDVDLKRQIGTSTKTMARIRSIYQSPKQ